MAATNTTIDEVLYEGLQQARKKKPRYFALVAKGTDVVGLIVQKKKINEGQIQKAKAEWKGNDVIEGVCYGEGAELTFEVLVDVPRIKSTKLKEFIHERTELTLKPQWAVVPELSAVLEDDQPAVGPAQVGAAANANDLKDRRDALVRRLLDRKDFFHKNAPNTQKLLELSQRASDLVDQGSAEASATLDKLEQVIKAIEKSAQQPVQKQTAPDAASDANGLKVRRDALLRRLMDRMEFFHKNAPNTQKLLELSQRASDLVDQGSADASATLDKLEQVINAIEKSAPVTAPQQAAAPAAITKELIAEFFGDALSNTSPPDVLAEAATILTELKDCQAETNPDRQAQQMQALRARAAQVGARALEAIQPKLEADVMERREIARKNKAGAQLVAKIDERFAACKAMPDQKQRHQEFKDLIAQAGDYAIVIAACHSKLRTNPEKKRYFLGELDKDPAPSELAALVAELETLEAEGSQRAAPAIAEVMALTDAEVKQLAPEARIKLLEALRYSQSESEKNAALAKIYLLTDLDQAFQKKDHKMRTGVLAKLAGDKDLMEAGASWTTTAPAKRASVLGKALEVQCAAMREALGLTQEEMPTPAIKLSSDPNCGVSAERWEGLAGGYSEYDCNIYLKDEPKSKSATDFYYALNTTLHENTHAFQDKLVQLLEAGKLPKDSEYYNQALLFQQDMGPGYISRDSGYKEQPTELHAHLAGDEAEDILRSLATAPRLIQRMEAWASKNPGPGSAEVPAWCKTLSELVSGWESQENAADLAKATGDLETRFNTLVAAAARPANANGPPADEAQKLREELAAWGKGNTGHAPAIQALLERMATMPNRQAQRDNLIRTIRNEFDTLKTRD